jgi:hypothetical protein
MCRYPAASAAATAARLVRRRLKDPETERRDVDAVVERDGFHLAEPTRLDCGQSTAQDYTGFTRATTLTG